MFQATEKKSQWHFRGSRHSPTATRQYLHSSGHSSQSSPKKKKACAHRLLWSTDPPTILINRHSSDTSDIVRRHGRMYEHTYTHTHARTHTWYSWGMKLSMMSICSRSSRLKWRMFSSRPSISLWCSCWRSAICTMEDKRHVMGNGVCDI